MFVRNLLFSFGIVNKLDHDVYSLNPKFSHFIPKDSSKYSLKQFEEDQEKRKLVGLMYQLLKSLIELKAKKPWVLSLQNK